MTAGCKAPPLRVVHAEGERDAGQDGDGRPTIIVEAGELPRAVDEALLALAGDAMRLRSAPPASGDGAAPMIESGIVFKRGGLLARIVLEGGQRNGVERAPAAPVFGDVGVDYLVERLTLIASFEKIDRRQKATRRIDCPDKVARILLARREYPSLPDVAAIVETPIVAADGRVLQTPGFDERTGLLLVFDPADFAPVPDKPTRQQMDLALVTINELIDGFAFEDAVDRAAAIAMLATGLVRPALPAAPMFTITAPAAASGKTFLARLVAVLRSGREPAITVFDAQDPAEFSKRVFSLLLAGDAVIVLDNVEGDMNSPDLCAVLTSPEIQGRVLGASEMRRVPSSAMWIATGNNIRPRGDLARRVIDVRLDTRLEHPGDRVYAFDPLERARETRGRLVCALLTLMRGAAARAWRGKFDPPAQFASFERWSRLVRVPLLMMGLPDPCAKVRAAEDLDPERAQLRAVLDAWKRQIGTKKPVSLADVIRRAQEFARAPAAPDLTSDPAKPPKKARPADRALLDALLDVGGSPSAEINRRTLGRWLARYEGRIEDGHMLRRSGSRAGVVLWHLASTKADKG